MTKPSSYFPEKFNLSDGPVQSVETSETDPRVVYDANGFRATDAGGHLIFSLDAATGAGSFAGNIDLVADAVGQHVDWHDTTLAGAVTGSIVGQSSAGTRNLGIVSQGLTASDSVVSLLQAFSSVFNRYAGLEVSADDGTLGKSGQSRVQVSAGSFGRVILDNAGNSDFLNKRDQWHNVAYGSNWTGSTLAYYSDGDRIWFRGDAVNNGAFTFGQASALIGTLPVGIRPTTNTAQIVVPFTDSANGNGMTFININTDGTVVPAGGFIGGVSGNGGSRFRFSGFSYRITN